MKALNLTVSQSPARENNHDGGREDRSLPTVETGRNGSSAHTGKLNGSRRTMNCREGDQGEQCLDKLYFLKRYGQNEQLKNNEDRYRENE